MGQVTAGGPGLARLGSGRVFESLMEKVVPCGIVFLFVEEEEEEEEVVVVMGMESLEVHSLELSDMIVGLKVWLLITRRVSFLCGGSGG